MNALVRSLPLAILVTAATGGPPAAAPSAPAAIAVLAADANLHDKAAACQLLAVIGGPEAVPALAALLADDQLSAYSRTALESIAAPAAGEALRDAMPKLDGPRLAGVIDSLGVRRDAAAVPALQKLVADPARGAAPAAISALGKIATPEALATVRAALTASAADLRVAAAHAVMAAADRCARDGQAQAAQELLASVSAANLPAHLRAAATARAAALRASPALTKPSRGRPLFDGKTFDGWEGDLRWFRIAGACIVAGNLNKDIPVNEFLATTREFADFELRLKVRLVNGKGNGGIQFRSARVANSREMAGYQADAAATYWGGLYDESRRRAFLGTPPDPALIAKVLQPDAWNAYVIRCEGPRIRLWLNGQLTLDFTEPDPAIPRCGRIGLQIHAGAPAEAWYQDIELEELAAAKP